MARLPPPGANFSRLPLDVQVLSPSVLCRISTHDTGEPYFGRSRGNRFDDPQAKRANRFGTCYLGLNLTVAIAESLLHNAEPENGRFVVPVSEIDACYAFRFSGPGLRLANLTGTPLQVDGFLYMSRRVNDSMAVVLFERDPKKPLALTPSSPIRLCAHPEFAASVHRLRLGAT